MARATNPAEYRIEEVQDLGQVEAVRDLQAEIWGSAAIACPSTLLWVISQAGGTVLLASAGDRPIGFAYGFVGRSQTGVVYHRSHAAGVLPEFQNSGIGRALKLAQGKAVRASGLSRIVWTFDPSQIRNAHFNLRRLGATARGFCRDYYGQRDDALSRGLPTDRLLVEWFLDEAESSELARLRRRADLVRVLVPQGLPARPGDDPQRAKGPQAELRAGLETALASGLQVIDFDAESRSYLLAELPPSFPGPAELMPGSSA
ncbi:MAG TPA: GNAT family N-acetyltransferase [Candidatus Dormibacteraeota bacterium]